MSGLIAGLTATTTDERVRVIRLEGRGDHFCGGADIVARNAGGKHPPARRQHPAPPPDPGPPADPAALHGADPGRLRGSRLGRGHRVPARARRPISLLPRTTRRSGNRSASAVSPPTVARRGCCRVGSATFAPANCCSSAGSSRAPRRPSGAPIHRAVPAAELTAAADELTNALAQGPSVALGLTKWLLHQGVAASLDQQLANEAFALELSSRSDDFREGLAAFKERRPPKFSGR